MVTSIEIEKKNGLFEDSSGNRYGFSVINKKNSNHISIIKKYMIGDGRYVNYNDGEMQDFDKKIREGFYDSSFLIYDRSGKVNSVVIYYKDNLTYGVSALFIDPKRVRVPLLFAISYYNEFIDSSFMVFNTELKFIRDYYKRFDVKKVNKDTFYFMKNNQDPLAKFI